MEHALLQNDILPKPSISKLHKYWDKAAVFIHIFQQFYWYFLIIYYWNTNIELSRYSMTIALSVSSFLGLIINIIWVSIKSNSYDRYQKVLAWIVVVYYPFTILFLYLNRHSNRNALYGLLFTQTIFLSVPIFLITSYHLIHDYDHNNILLLFSIILFSISILLLYPLFMPLQTMNYKLLTLKLAIFSLQIIRILFTVYTFYMVIFPKNEVINKLIYDLYNFYLIKLFWISPGIVIWTFIWVSFENYTLDWFYIKNLKEIWSEYYESSCTVKVMCFLCLVVRIIINIFVIYPEYLILLGSFYLIYLWIFFEFYVLNIMDTFMFFDDDKLFSNELYGFKLHNYNFKIFDIITKYLSNINDDLDYQSRLYILHYLRTTNSPKVDRNHLCKLMNEATNLSQGMQNIIKGINLNEPIYFQDCKSSPFWHLLSKKFLEHLRNQCKKLKMNIFFSVRDNNLLHVYDFQNGTFNFDSNHIIAIIWELLGILIIIPAHFICTLIVSIVVPIILYIMYFKIYCDGYQFIDYLLDFKFWILNIYLLLLMIALILFVYQWKLVKIWYDCYMFTRAKSNQKASYLAIRHIEKYHNFIRNQRMIYSILTSFFGSLSVEIMQYLGIMDQNDCIIVPFGVDTNLEDETELYQHYDNNVVCNEYVFDLNVQ